MLGVGSLDPWKYKGGVRLCFDPPHPFVSLGSWVISRTGFGACVTNLNEPPRAVATSTIAWARKIAPSLLGRCKQKQSGLRGLLCRWPSITEWEVHITAQCPPDLLAGGDGFLPNNPAPALGLQSCSQWKMLGKPLKPATLAVTGHLSEGSFVQNVVVQIQKYYANLI